jgi:hypothetical protein
MSEPFLEEQLRRIRLMTERIAEARTRQQELSRQIELDRVRRRDRENHRENRSMGPVDAPRELGSAARHEHERETAHDRAAEPVARRRASTVRRRR